MLSTDIPGAFGDEAGGLGSHERLADPAARRGAFAPFGGTPAACATAAGVASLIQAARRRRRQEPLTGPALKRHMLAHGRTLEAGPGGARVAALDARACLDAL